MPLFEKSPTRMKTKATTKKMTMMMDDDDDNDDGYSE
jgi:hypothetical protein